MKRINQIFFATCTWVILSTGLTAHAEVDKVVLARQFGIGYLQLAVMDQMKALRETMPKMEDSQKQIFALMSESEQNAFKTKLDANEKQMKSKRGADEMGSDEKGDGKGKGKGKGKGNAGGKPGDGAPPPGGDSDKAPPPPPFDP